MWPLQVARQNLQKLLRLFHVKYFMFNNSLTKATREISQFYVIIL